MKKKPSTGTAHRDTALNLWVVLARAFDSIARHARDTFNARQARSNNPIARALIKRLRIVGA